MNDPATAPSRWPPGGRSLYMIDPRPGHEWEGVEDLGYPIPIDDAAVLLRELNGE